MTEPTYSSGKNRRLDIRLGDRDDLHRIGPVAGIIDVDCLAVPQGHLVLHRRGRDDQSDVKLPLQTLLDHVEVQQAEKPATKSETQGRRTVFFIGQRRIVDRQLVHGRAQVFVVVGVHRVDRGEDDLFGFLIAWNRFRRLPLQVRDRIADLDIADALDSGDDVAHLAGAELFSWIEFQLVVAQLLDGIIAAHVHEMDVVARFQRAFHDAALQNHAAVAIEMGVEDQHLQRRVGIALGSGQLVDDARQHILDAEAGFGGNPILWTG